MKRLVVLGVVGVLLCGAGYTLHAKTHTHKEVGVYHLHESEKYPLLDKSLFLVGPNDQIINFASLRQQMQSYFKDNSLNGGMYFEYLPTGVSIRVNDNQMEVAASLLKLPAAMDLYKTAETKKLDLDKEISLQSSWLNDSFGDLYKKGEGYKLTLREAAKIMLEQSDNTALQAVVNTNALTPLNQEDSALNALDVELKQNQDLTVSISTKSYSSFLKCLYYACLLNKADSNELLDYLTNTLFDERLVAGIGDKGIKVAHKIGVASKEVQSDCGIVYVPSRNYILCVMLHGDKNPETDKHIAKLSNLAYSYVTSKK